MDGTRIVITDGRPTDAELAAVTTAVRSHVERRRTRARAAVPSRTSRWIMAARLEASGHPPIDAPAGLTR